MPVYASSCLPMAMRGVRSAIELDNGEKVREAYISYLSSMLYIIKNLKDDACGNDFGNVCDKDTLKLIKILEHCLGRTSDLVSSFHKNDSKKESKKIDYLQQEDTPNNDSQKNMDVGPKNEPKNAANSLGTTPDSKNIERLIDSLPTPPSRKKSFNSGLTRRVSSVERIQNKQMFQAYQRRRSLIQQKYQADYNLSLFRKTFEDMAIKEAKRKILEQRLEKRREYFRLKAEERISMATGSRVTDAAYEKKIYTKVLEFEQETAWPQKLREKLESEPENTKLIEDTVMTVLSAKEHPLGQEMAEMQYALYRELSLIVSNFSCPVYPDFEENDTFDKKNLESNGEKNESHAQSRQGDDGVLQNANDRSEFGEEENEEVAIGASERDLANAVANRDSLDSKMPEEKTNEERPTSAKMEEIIDTDGKLSHITDVAENSNDSSFDSMGTSSRAFESAFQDLEDFMMDSMESDSFELLPDENGLTSEAAKNKESSEEVAVTSGLDQLEEEVGKVSENQREFPGNQETNEFSPCNQNCECAIQVDTKRTGNIKEKEKDCELDENEYIVTSETEGLAKQQGGSHFDEGKCVIDSQSVICGNADDDSERLNDKAIAGSVESFTDENKISEEETLSAADDEKVSSRADLHCSEGEINTCEECNKELASEDRFSTEAQHESRSQLLYKCISCSKKDKNTNEDVICESSREDFTAYQAGEKEEFSSEQEATDLNCSDDMKNNLKVESEEAESLDSDKLAANDKDKSSSESFDAKNEEGVVDKEQKGDFEAEKGAHSEAEDGAKDGLDDSQHSDVSDVISRRIFERYLNDSSNYDDMKSKVDKVVKEIHTSLGKLHSLLVVTYKELDLPIGRDQSYAALESVFFKPLWQWVNLAFRRLNIKKEVILYEVIQKRRHCNPTQFFVRDKFSLLESEQCEASYPYKVAVDELRKIISLSSPLEKLECIVSTTKLICQCATDFWKKQGESSPPNIGCDDLLPILTYVVVKTALPQLVSECHAMEEFIHESYLLGEEGYCLTTLSTAISYCLNLQQGSMYKSS
ncbi:uncharacterized protein LOC135690824 [Rhopilema esculentum]|uniref:uncharacterized protein LOC135690824 n=1 Tax=Rhopilema esculentum TaxID=499914 RepID=UPI0031DA7F3C